MENENPDLKRLHLDQVNQEYILEITRSVLENSGIKNHFQAHYLQECSSIVKTDSSGILLPLTANINILDSTQWQLAIMATIAFLRRNKMEFTLSAMKNEWKVLINETGFKRGKELDAFFEQIIHREPLQFDEKVQEFRILHNLPETPALISSNNNQTNATFSIQNKKKLKKHV